MCASTKRVPPCHAMPPTHHCPQVHYYEGEKVSGRTTEPELLANLKPGDLFKQATYNVVVSLLAA